MFEKEAEEYLIRNLCKTCLTICENNCSHAESEKRAFKNGAEFGYNKANEWHYVKDGDKPSESKDYLTYKINGYGCHTTDITYFNSERHFWCVDCQNDVIAWKEIVLPKESE